MRETEILDSPESAVAAANVVAGAQLASRSRPRAHSATSRPRHRRRARDMPLENDAPAAPEGASVSSLPPNMAEIRARLEARQAKNRERAEAAERGENLAELHILCCEEDAAFDGRRCCAGDECRRIRGSEGWAGRDRRASPAERREAAHALRVVEGGLHDDADIVSVRRVQEAALDVAVAVTSSSVLVVLLLWLLVLLLQLFLLLMLCLHLPWLWMWSS